MEKEMVVALDAMGGDFAPMEPVKGAVDAANEMQVCVKLIGQEDRIRKELEQYTYPQDRIEIVHAEEIIGTDESPTMAIRRKKNSSMVVGEKRRSGRFCFGRKHWGTFDWFLVDCRQTTWRGASGTGNLPADEKRIHIFGRQRCKCGLQGEVFGAIW